MLHHLEWPPVGSEWLRDVPPGTEARLNDDGIEATLEHRDRLLAEAARMPEPLRTAMLAKADHLSAEAGIARMRLLAFMLKHGVEAEELEWECRGEHDALRDEGEQVCLKCQAWVGV